MDSNKVQQIAAANSGTVASSRNSTILSVPPDRTKDTCKMVRAVFPELYHLSTVTGMDMGNAIEITYHFWSGHEFLSVRTDVPKENLVLDSLSDFLSASTLYEAEIKDMLGVEFKGNPLMGRKLLLPDNYPAEAPPPLRKEADPEKIRKMMELE